MGFLKRLGYYLSGFSIGLVILFFLFNGKRTQCNYSPQARVLNDLSKKEWVGDTQNFSSIDSSTVAQFLSHARVDFGASKTHLDSCKIYVLKIQDPTPTTLTVRNCSTKVFVLDAN